MDLRQVLRRGAATLLILALAACGGAFRTYYPEAAPAKNWRVSGVHVDVPRSLVVSEEETFLPRADIVWREDKRGDRYAQVAKIMTDAIRRGAKDAKGAQPVVLDVTVTRFHAMTFTAELHAPGGVHDVEFDITARSAKTGKVVFGPEHIEASFPAMVGVQMAEARAQGQSQKSQIEDHVARTIAGWLGRGPDIRSNFSSIGG